MDYDASFDKMLKGYCLTTVNVIYYRPDYRNILQEYIFQDYDLSPEYPRVHRFLEHWHKEIDAIIKEILICSDKQLRPRRFDSIDHFFTIN